MSSQVFIVTPIQDGWAVDLPSGRRLASFRGPAAHTRALHYLEQVIGRDRLDRQPRQ